MQVAEPALVIHERHGIWAAKFRRHADCIALVETRIWEDQIRELTARKFCIAMFEADAKRLDIWARRAAEIKHQFGDHHFMIVGDRELKRYGWLFGELGACLVVHDFSTLRTAIRVVQRHFKNVPQPELSLTESIQQRLPWQAVTRSHSNQK